MCNLLCHVFSDPVPRRVTDALRLSRPRDADFRLDEGRDGYQRHPAHRSDEGLHRTHLAHILFDAATALSLVKHNCLSGYLNGC